MLLRYKFKNAVEDNPLNLPEDKAVVQQLLEGLATSFGQSGKRVSRTENEIEIHRDVTRKQADAIVGHLQQAFARLNTQWKNAAGDESSHLAIRFSVDRSVRGEVTCTTELFAAPNASAN